MVYSNSPDAIDRPRIPSNSGCSRVSSQYVVIEGTLGGGGRGNITVFVLRRRAPQRAISPLPTRCVGSSVRARGLRRGGIHMCRSTTSLVMHGVRRIHRVSSFGRVRLAFFFSCCSEGHCFHNSSSVRPLSSRQRDTCPPTRLERSRAEEGQIIHSTFFEDVRTRATALVDRRVRLFFDDKTIKAIALVTLCFTPAPPLKYLVNHPGFFPSFFVVSRFLANCCQAREWMKQLQVGLERA